MSTAAKKRPQVKVLNIQQQDKKTEGAGAKDGAGKDGDADGWTQSGSYALGDIRIKQYGVKREASKATPTESSATASGAGPSSSESSSANNEAGGGGGGDDGDQPDIMPDDLVEDRILGKGASGVVLLARHKKTEKLYAVKIINIGLGVDSKMIAQEVNTIDYTCPYLVRANTAFIRDKHLHIVQEFMDKGSLYDVMRCHKGGIPEHVVAGIADQVIRGLAHLHAGDKGKKSKLHRDLKPANILVNSDGRVKISDFGVATTDSTRGHSTFVGTTTYMCPERIKGERYSVASDIWAAGLTFCEAILGYYPYKSTHASFIQLLMEITKVQNFNFPEGTSEHCKEFILSCMKQKPDDRPSAQQLLEHAFLKDHNANSQATQEELAKWLATVTIVPEADEPGRGPGTIQ